jgi:hypothetical protein
MALCIFVSCVTPCGCLNFTHIERITTFIRLM